MKKKVLCVVGNWESGGVESFFSRLYGEMVDSDIELDIAINSFCKNSIFTKLFQQNNIHLLRYGFSRKYISMYLAVWRLLPILWKNKYDVVHSNIGMLNAAVIFMAFLLRIPKRISHIHENITPLSENKKQYLKYLISRPCALVLRCTATHLWAVSKLAGQAFYGIDAFCVIKNGIILKDFQFSEQQRSEIRKKRHWEDQFVIINVARLDRNKNQSFLLDCFKEFLALHPSSYLILIGDGTIKSDLQRKARRLAIAGRVCFNKHCSDVSSILQGADVFVLPSLKEGLGIAALEAQSCGLPCLLSEGVPPETSVCNTLRLSLQSGPAHWADVLKQIAEKKMPRQDCTLQLKTAGFDIKTVAQFVREEYLK